MTFPSDLFAVGKIPVPPAGWPEQFESSGNFAFDFEATIEQAAWWENAVHRRYGLFPTDIADKLRPGMPNDMDVRLLAILPEDDSFSLALTWPGSGDPMMLFGSTYKMSLSFVFHDSLSSEGASQDAGYTKTFLRNTKALCNDLGFVSMQLESAMIGRYAWARYGFTPSFVHWNNVVRPLVASRASKIWTKLTDDEREKLTFALRSPYPRSIWVVADLSRRVGVSSQLEPLTRAKDVSIGMLLLAGTGEKWASILDFRDDAARNRFNAYTGAKE